MIRLRRHLASGIALVVVVPLLAAVMIGVPVLESGDRLSAPTDVAEGSSAAAGGLEFSIRAAAEFPSGSGSITLPAGAALIAAIVDVAPAEGERTLSCRVELSAPGPDGRITWPGETAVEGYGYRRGDEEFTAYCDPTAEDPTSVEAVFLVPEGLLGTATVDVTVQEGERSRTLRLELPQGRSS
ncbi:hypothetical protein [Rathayibacter sp. VKM Ac-2760]|uniref:hypothetical protein n=1 Tax=Rathayibacter sp. VKM Ac-2760 TaxID=2609253 RepID=UPI001318EA40|nr:hypothetical protein [Rathayibacter sp. VKM Ac-2760]QHC60499.1 hypothetical protein GSU72_19505 [Rathayibacter sp. VKM Ac-2760]